VTIQPEKETTMSQANLEEQKFLINCSDGANNPERATVSFLLAVTAAQTSETAVFATADAAGLCVKGGPACAKAKGITADDLIEGVEIAGAPRTMAFVASGARLLA
jgi:uncharacterized protein